MPRSKFSTLIKKYNVKQTPLTFPLRFGPKQFNTTIKKLLKDDNVDTENINFNFFINGELLTGPLDEFIETKNMSQEIEEITYDIEMQPPSLEGEIKTEDVVIKMSFRSKWLLTAGYDVQIFDATALDKPVIFIEMKDDMSAVEWLSFDEATETGVIIVGGQYGQISLWRCNMIDRTSIQICKFIGQKQWISCLSVNNELGLLASGTQNGLLDIWSTDLSDIDMNGQKVISRSPLMTEVSHSRSITHIQWLQKPIESPHSGLGNLLTCSDDHYLKLWNVNANQCASVREENTTNPIRSIDYNQDNGLIVVGSDNNRLKVYNFSVPDCQVNNLFKAHNGTIVAVKWIPGNGNYFLTAGIRSSVKMWDSRAVVASILQVSSYNLASIISMAVSEDGRFLAFSYGNKVMRLLKFQE